MRASLSALRYRRKSVALSKGCCTRPGPKDFHGLPRLRVVAGKLVDIMIYDDIVLRPRSVDGYHQRESKQGSIAAYHIISSSEPGGVQVSWTLKLRNGTEWNSCRRELWLVNIFEKWSWYDTEFIVLKFIISDYAIQVWLFFLYSIFRRLFRTGGVGLHQVWLE